MIEEELLVYKCEGVQARVERIRARVRHPQEVDMPLVLLLTKKMRSCFDEYEELYLELIDVCDPADTTTYEKNRKEFLKLLGETRRAIQTIEFALLYPPELYQPVMYVPVQFLQPQETRIQIESAVTPGVGEIGCAVATCYQPAEPPSIDPTKVVIKVGAPVVPLLPDVIPSHDDLHRENPPAIPEKLLPKVGPLQTAISAREPTVAAEAALSPTMLDNQVTVVQDGLNAAQATSSDESDSSHSSRASTAHTNHVDANVVATSPSTTQCAVAADVPQSHKPTKATSHPGIPHQEDLRVYGRRSAKESSCIGSMKQQRPRKRKWRYQPPRAPDSTTTTAAANRFRRPDPDSSVSRTIIEHLQQAKKPPDILQLPVLSEALQPSAGGRMFGLHPNVVKWCELPIFAQMPFSVQPDATLPT